MNNTKIYKILYYLILVITFAVVLSTSLTMFPFHIDFYTPDTIFDYIDDLYTSNNILGIINLISVVLFSILLIKKKLKNANIIVPIIYLLFMLIIVIISLMYNSKLIEPNIQYNYHLSFILVGYLFINIYSLLCLTKK